jgi:hypothetical protein
MSLGTEGWSVIIDLNYLPLDFFFWFPGLDFEVANPSFYTQATLACTDFEVANPSFESTPKSSLPPTLIKDREQTLAGSN